MTTYEEVMEARGDREWQDGDDSELYDAGYRQGLADAGADVRYTVYLDCEDELQSVEPSGFFTELDDALAYRDTIHEEATAEGWDGVRSVMLVVGERRWV